MILADESANWKIGGLRQLERLILALNEFAEAAEYQHEIAVLVYERIGNSDYSAAAFTRPCRKRTFNVGRVTAGFGDNGYAERWRRRLR